MSPATHVGAFEVRVEGAALPTNVADRLLDAKVQDDLLLPDTFQLRFRDPAFELCDGALLEVGKKVEIRVSPPIESGAARVLFTGEVATLAPEFEAGGCVFVVRGYDISHRLNRTRRSRTFQDMTVSDIVTKVLGETGLDHEVAATTEVARFEQQSNETDWTFLWRLAGRSGHAISCLDGRIQFRPAGRADDPAVRLEWGQQLRGFHPRATAAQQVSEVEVSGWDPDSARRVSGVASTPRMDSSIGMQQAQASGANGGGKMLVTDRVVTSQGEADALAQSTLDHLANAWLEAEGNADGDPRLQAGALIEVAGIGQRFGGKYMITSATHLMRGGAGYETRFRVSGRARRTLLDLLTPSSQVGYAEALVIGLVTNVDDPQGQGRVRVKFPALDESNEGWWARVASMAATGGRGVSMSPLVGDEVVVGFEQGDERRPIVLGSMWNGNSPPGDLVKNAGSAPGGGGGGGRSASDGSFNLSSQKAVTIAATNEFDLTSKDYGIKAGGDAKITVDGASTTKVSGTTSHESTGAMSLESSDSVSIKGASSVEVSADGTVKLSGASIEVNATGTLKLSGASVMIG